ncbi:MAG: hypothetical protein L7V86_16285 [Verrucomicrobiales bacterium]|nr:hypothetical protein [Verrucomicrobiales bacterium]
MQQSILLTLTFLASALFSVTAEEVSKPINKVCPYSGEDIDAEQMVTYTKVVGVCCDKCKAKLQDKPGKHLKKIAGIKASHVNSKCPLSGKDVDGATTVDFRGAKVGVCCEKCESKFDAAKHGEKVVMDKAANDKCPFSDKDIDAESHAIVSFQVGVCCGKCAKKFAAAPADTLAKVSVSDSE